MPTFPNLNDSQLDQLLTFLKNPTATPKDLSSDKKEMESVAATAADTDALGMPSIETRKPRPQYSFTGYRKFLDPDHYPAIAPPWGTLNAIDLNTGEYLWKIPLGEYPDLAAKGMKNTGSENYGGPIVTAAGIVFICASLYDYKFHAFDARTGKLLWETKLPYAGRATPATYMVDGKQFIVVATGGGRYQIAPAKGVYVAFTLP
jgi:quinoprotein glucose dehydrogenase